MGGIYYYKIRLIFLVIALRFTRCTVQALKRQFPVAKIILVVVFYTERLYEVSSDFGDEGGVGSEEFEPRKCGGVCICGTFRGVP